VFNLALLSGRGLVASPQATAFLTRTSGLDTKHTNMYINLINGLVSDGVWGKLDALYFLATQNSTTALLNLVSSSFAITANGAPAFVADQGYTGVNNSTTVYLDTGFNPSTAGGNFSQNSAHISFWSNTNPATGLTAMSVNATSGTQVNIFPRFSDSKAYWRINDSNAALSAGVTVGTQIGYYVANRSGASTQNGFINAVDQGVVSVASGAVVNFNMTILGQNISGTHSGGYPGQCSVASIGGSLSSTDVTNLYNRISTARTTLGLS